MDSVSPVRASGSLEKGGLWVFQLYRSEAENGQYELGFLALSQFLKGTLELSILPSLPPSDPFAGVTGR